MKQIKSLLLFTAFSISFTITAQDFTWMKGSANPNQYGTYGTLGSPSQANTPGARTGAATWVDQAGNLWLFGGNGYPSSGGGSMNDLWKYDIGNNEWTWIKGSNLGDQTGVYGTKGVSAPSNCPGARMLPGAWADNSGNLWLFGGLGWGSTTSSNSWLNDLWKYNIASNEWTWMKGANINDQPSVYGTLGTGSSSTTPGARETPCSWTDGNGDLWLFGGGGCTPFCGLMNDLWLYDVSADQWIWKGGSNNVNQNGTYGTKGVPSTANIPGARRYLQCSSDPSGNFWLFGGEGYGASGVGHLNDLWKFNPSTAQWTWVSGSNQINQFGVYGTQNVPAGTNIPGARKGNALWADNTGDIWMLGGWAYGAATSTTTQRNDMWKYDVSAGDWTWVKGTVTPMQNAVFGTQGVPAPGNMPASRAWSMKWTDQSGNLWLFGGNVMVNSNLGWGNELWKFELCSGPSSPTITSISTPMLCANKNATLTAAGTGTISWYSSATGGTVLATGNSFVTPNLTGNTVYYAQALTCGPSATRTAVSLTVHPLPSVTASGVKTLICQGETASLGANGASAYTWMPGNLTGFIVQVSPASTTIYTITGTNANGCSNIALITVSVDVCTGLTANTAWQVYPSVTVFPNPSYGEVQVRTTGARMVSISNELGQVVRETTITENTGEVSLTDLAPGFYTISASGDQGSTRFKFVIISH